MDPIWITLYCKETKKVIFEGNQLHWADVFFSNATYFSIMDDLENSPYFENTLSEVRFMTKEEILKWPGIQDFVNSLYAGIV